MKEDEQWVGHHRTKQRGPWSTLGYIHCTSWEQELHHLIDLQTYLPSHIH